MGVGEEVLTPRQMDAVESFVLLGRACSRIDAELRMREGFAHDSVIRWWQADMDGERTRAVGRWVEPVVDLACSGEEEAFVPLCGLKAERVRALLDAAARHANLDSKVRAANRGRSVCVVKRRH